jgi:nucleosome binding factor SPN SPT16 subunit
MFAIDLDLFSIRAIIIPTHIEWISKSVFILDINITKLISKQHVELICVLAINLVIPLDIVKQHLLETFFHAKVGEMIIDETHVREQI